MNSNKIKLFGRTHNKNSTMPEKQIFDHISKNEISDLKAKLTAHNGSVDFTDENGKLSINIKFVPEKLK